jgi:hypothetical protein
MKIYVLISFSEELGPGSSAGIDIKLYATESLRDQAIQWWNKQFAHLQKASEPNAYFGPGGWKYWLETENINLIEE